jgi:3-hydroxyacyl-CoA dehydrogenase/enoyl-CoA hydratase/3-hydroxybutyryl-CoA epimerase
MPKHAVFASNTSTLPITGLAEAWKAAGRDEGAFIGIHFFSPVDKMQLVEIIKGKQSNATALAASVDYVKRIRKTPIVVNDSRGFYTSRVFGTYTREGMEMLVEGVNPALIENAGKMTGMPMPPLALTDEVALDLVYKVGKQTAKDLGAAYKPSKVDPIIEKMVVELKRVGKKVGKGFYDWPSDPSGKKMLWPGINQLVKRLPDDKQPSVDELKKRFLYRQAVEAARCYEENVVTDPADADVGAILGWGFAPWTGGPLSFIDTVGLKAFVAECDRLAQLHGERFKPNDLLRKMAAGGQTFYGKGAKSAAGAWLLQRLRTSKGAPRRPLMFTRLFSLGCQGRSRCWRAAFFPWVPARPFSASRRPKRPYRRRRPLPFPLPPSPSGAWPGRRADIRTRGAVSGLRLRP